MSSYISQCMARANASISELRRAGSVANVLELSPDVWRKIQMGGFNMVQQDVFAGLPVRLKENLEDHIEAACFTGWIPLASGPLEGRQVTLSIYLPDETLRVSTTQLGTSVVPGSASQGASIFPTVIDAGSAIEVHGSTTAELMKELVSIDFSPAAAQSVADTAASKWPRSR